MATVDVFNSSVLDDEDSDCADSVESVTSSVGSADIAFAAFFCKAPISTYACEEYCDCVCDGVRVHCYENPTTCPPSIQNTCRSNCGPATK
jgi:hypothetical protein